VELVTRCTVVCKKAARQLQLSVLPAGWAHHGRSCSLPVAGYGFTKRGQVL